MDPTEVCTIKCYGELINRGKLGPSFPKNVLPVYKYPGRVDMTSFVDFKSFIELTGSNVIFFGKQDQFLLLAGIGDDWFKEISRRPSWTKGASWKQLLQAEEWRDNLAAFGQMSSKNLCLFAGVNLPNITRNAKLTDAPYAGDNVLVDIPLPNGLVARDLLVNFSENPLRRGGDIMYTLASKDLRFVQLSPSEVIGSKILVDKPAEPKLLLDLTKAEEVKRIIKEMGYQVDADDYSFLSK